MTAPAAFRAGDIVRVRGREWVVLPCESEEEDVLRLRPLGGGDEDATVLYAPLEPEPPVPAVFSPPDPDRPGTRRAARLLRDALRLKLRNGAGAFRSFGNLAFEPRAYQLVPLLMALKTDVIRLLIADDVGIGKTIEAGLIAREMIDRGEISRTVVICPPHLCDQWRDELSSKFHIDAAIVTTATAARLERGLRPGESVFEAYPHTVVSLDYIKADRRRDEFLRACPEFVIVDEAHTCARSDTAVRHQRRRLLYGLANGDRERHMVLLTATPHSGDDAAFHNLLGLLSPDFVALRDMKEGEERTGLRDRLANHFVQRRRGDIAEWRDTAGFPVRESREATYILGGDWGALFDDVLEYARGMVRRTEKGSLLEQRMSWWAALALLRCVSSSPAAAAVALRTRLLAAGGATEAECVDLLDRAAGERVLDGSAEDGLPTDESVPAGTVGDADGAPRDAAILNGLIARAGKIRGVANDPKAALVVEEVRRLIEDGFHPVVFCRYIATAGYLMDVFTDAFDSAVRVICVTGELPPEEREDRIRKLDGLEDGVTPLLVATDCLSEGINLQRNFDAVVHYDLTWNPTRLEQREGRADRFGQGSKVVRTLMLYGENNPVDGAVLKVILRKAEKIRKELGVAVPLPMDNTKVIEAIMQSVLLRTSGKKSGAPQLSLGFDDEERQVDIAWQAAKERVSRTVFAQKRLKPDDVLPEWNKAVSVLGGAGDVGRFVGDACDRLGAPLEKKRGCFRLPARHLPAALRDRLESVGITGAERLAFDLPAPTGAVCVTRSHPLVAALADFVAESALETGDATLAARCAAFFTGGVSVRTTLYLLRARYQIVVERRGKSAAAAGERSLMAEECLGVAVEGASGGLRALAEDTALSLLSLEADKNMADGQKTMLIRQAVAALEPLAPEFDALVRRRADELLADHRRVREAAEIRGVRYAVVPALPADVIGVYVLMPVVGANSGRRGETER